ncbi:hypothetical protein BH11ACT8_BH11ACT8_30550 [soil metagenome]
MVQVRADPATRPEPDELTLEQSDRLDERRAQIDPMVVSFRWD